MYSLKTEGREISAPICQEYLHTFNTRYNLEIGISLLIVIVNVLLKRTSAFLARQVGYDTKSKMLSVVQVAVFATQFFNMAFSMLLLHANLDQSGLGVGLLNGEFPDYTESWYREVGIYIVQPMVI